MVATDRGTGTSRVRGAFLETADVVVDLLSSAGTAERWEQPSVLPEMTVGDLAAHLARNVFMVVPQLTGPSSVFPVRPLLEHYATSPWVVAARDDEANAEIRRDAAAIARSGLPNLIEQVRSAGVELRRLLPVVPVDYAMTPPRRDWSLLVDDYLTARLVEVVVHLDDLAVSIDRQTPQVPEAAFEAVSEILLGIARWRHGSWPVLRALSRPDRAPKSISAF